ncbi:MAG: hypothetical protein WDN49_07725 [Acetobacteraceae bacterium]
MPDISADIVVVGLGAMGAATLFQLASQGVKVVGVDRYAPPHTLGSSHGETRITRCAVGEGAAYCAVRHGVPRDMAGDRGGDGANPAGGVPRRRTGQTLLVESGFLAIAPEGGANEASRHHGLPRHDLGPRPPILPPA